MKNTLSLLGITLFGAAVLVACGDDTQTGGGNTGGDNGGGNPTTGGGGGGPEGGNGGDGVGGSGGSPDPFPPPPEPGAQIDRMGRPAINTALNGAFLQFDSNGDPTAADPVVRGQLQDDYNEDMTEAAWDSYSDLFKANLAIIDALDTGLDLDGLGPNPPLTNAQACVNQGGSGMDLTNGDVNYATLGLVLPDDRLYANAAATGCSANEVAPNDPTNGFLGVELATLLELPAGCGGRRPIDDVIRVTYSLLTVGLPAGFDDGIDARDGQHPETFPYLADPTTNDP